MMRIVAVRGERGFLPEVPPDNLTSLLGDPGAHVWINVSGPAEESEIAIIRDVFQFHPLSIEDCFEEREQPKIDTFDAYLFVITHGLTAGSTPEEPEIVELDAFLGERFLVTHHSHPSRSIAATLDLVERNAGGPLRKGPAAVLHAIVDRQVDGIEPVLDGIETAIEDLEEHVFAHATRADLARLFALKHSTLHLRRWVSKQREVLLRLSRGEPDFVPAAEAPGFADVYDHLSRFTDQLDAFREMTTSLQETYLSLSNVRLGEIMKFLTLFTAVMMPLTVITGIYGMNFEHMPELQSRWAYPIVLGSMALTAGAILWFFRRRGWLGGEVPELED